MVAQVRQLLMFGKHHHILYIPSVCVSVCLCTCVCVSACVHVCLCTYMCLCVRVCVSVWMGMVKLQLHLFKVLRRRALISVITIMVNIAMSSFIPASLPYKNWISLLLQPQQNLHFVTGVWIQTVTGWVGRTSHKSPISPVNHRGKPPGSSPDSLEGGDRDGHRAPLFLSLFTFSL